MGMRRGQDYENLQEQLSVPRAWREYTLCKIHTLEKKGGYNYDQVNHLLSRFNLFLDFHYNSGRTNHGILF